MGNKSKAPAAPAQAKQAQRDAASSEQKADNKVKSKKQIEASSEEEGSSEEDEDDDAEPLELDIDNFGRPHGVVGTLDYNFRSIHRALHVPDDKTYLQLVQDCETAFTARAIENSEYSTGTTFFLPATMEPRCLLERMARQVFEFHTQDVQEYNPAKSGAEWWTLVLDAGETNDDVAFHWDRDYGLEDQYRVNLHPHIGTVTYLSDIGGPTVVLEKVSPVQTGSEDCGAGEITSGYISRPVLGKHISFDGRLLHGAPGDLADVFTSVTHESELNASGQKRKRETSSIQNGRRVTFLVNVWLNHKPIDSDPFPEDDLEKLACSPKTPVHFQFTEAESSQKPDEGICAVATQEAIKEGGEGAITTLDLSFKEANRKMTLLLPVPVTTLQREFRKSQASSFSVEFGEGNRAMLIAGDEVGSDDEDDDEEDEDGDDDDDDEEEEEEEDEEDDEDEE